MKFYKVISKDNKAKDGGNFDYSDYLPKGKRKGKLPPLIKNIEECETGYHVTPYWNMYLTDTSNRIFEVEVFGMKENLKVGVRDKYVCQKIRLIKEINPVYVDRMNTGNRNTGDSNTGNWNTGDSNTGDSNTGNRNTGDSNTGYRNTGDSNTGDSNTGNRNTGYRNTGYRNTGNSNTGNSNTGDRNTGYRNTGNRNTGDSNTGNWNTGNWNTGFFNTITPNNILIFNKECSREDWNKVKKPDFLYFELIDNNYKKSFKESFKKASKEDVKLLLKLPNFDYKVFEEISGISKKMIENKLK